MRYRESFRETGVAVGRLARVTALVGVALGAVLAPVDAAGRWTIQPTPNVPGGGSSTLTSVDCPADDFCLAVGSSGPAANGTAGATALVERWNGSRWAIMPARNRVGAEGSYLAGISCSTRDDCTAVGFALLPSGRSVTLVERWDGASWKIQRSPNRPAPWDNRLEAVSCVSATSCTAVGSVIKGQLREEPIALHWDGVDWTVEPFPVPVSAASARLNDIACTSSNACAAVGSYFVDADQWSLAGRWDGTAWAIQFVPEVQGASSSALLGVTCPTARVCVATGFSEDSARRLQPLAIRWRGVAWRIEATPRVAGAAASVLTSVSCVPGGHCMAAGSTGDGTQTVMAMRWDGGTWSLQDPALPASGRQSVFWSVDCPAVDACFAVGDRATARHDSATLAERYTG